MRLIRFGARRLGTAACGEAVISERRLVGQRRACEEEEPDLEGDQAEDRDRDKDTLDGVGSLIVWARLVAKAPIPRHPSHAGAAFILIHPSAAQRAADDERDPVADQDPGGDQDRQRRGQVPLRARYLRCDPHPADGDAKRNQQRQHHPGRV